MDVWLLNSIFRPSSNKNNNVKVGYNEGIFSGIIASTFCEYLRTKSSYFEEESLVNIKKSFNDLLMIHQYEFEVDLLCLFSMEWWVLNYL